MTDAIINFFDSVLKNDILTIIVIAIIPIIELRGSIPVGVAMGMELWQAFLLAWIGSSLVCPILLLILKPVLNWMKKTKIFRSLALAVESTFRSKADKVVSEEHINDPKSERKKMLGVYAFVAVPLPLTGVWTGSAIASFLNMPFWKALLCVVAGNLTAGAIVTTLTYFFADYVDIIITVFFIIVVIVLLSYIVMILIKINKNKNKQKPTIQSEGEKQENENNKCLTENNEEKEQENKRYIAKEENKNIKSNNEKEENKKNEP